MLPTRQCASPFRSFSFSDGTPLVAAHVARASTIDTLIARIIPGLSTAVAEFESVTVNTLYVPEDQTRAWEDTDARPARRTTTPALRRWYIGGNTTHGPLRDPRVRRAIAGGNGSFCSDTTLPPGDG